MSKVCKSTKKLSSFIIMVFTALISLFFPQISTPAPSNHNFTAVHEKHEKNVEIFKDPIEHKIELEKSVTESSSSSATATLSPSSSPKTIKQSLNELISLVLKIYPAKISDELDTLVKESGANEAQLRAIFEPIIDALEANNILPNEVKRLCMKNKMVSLFITILR